MRFSWLGLAACLVLWACGSDESDNFGGTSEPADVKLSEDDGEGSGEKQEPDGKSSREEKKDTTDKEYYIKSNLEATGDFSVDSVYDKYTSSYTYRIRTGNVVWYTQRMTESSVMVETMCYNNQNGNCSDYGRLFSALDNHAESACPDSTHLPSTRDWNLLDKYRAKYAEIDSLMDLKYGGFCEEDSVLKCSGKDTTGYYLTSDGKLYTIKNGKSRTSFLAENEFGFYNIRCVGYPSFVQSKKDLPACDSIRDISSALIYVFREKENYRCYPEKGEWLPDFSESCRDSGKTIVYHDTMMVCQDRLWQLADIDYSPNKCTAKTKDSLLWFNGIKYYCTGESWRTLTALEDSIGVCNKRRAGVNDTVFAGIDIKLYHCDSNEWREAVLDDYVGSCDDSSSVHMNDTIDFKNTRYICRGNGWVRYTELEELFGACVPEKMFMFENGSYDIDDYRTEYMCDTSGWIEYRVDDVIGGCDSVHKEMITEFRGEYYRCNGVRWEQGLNYKWPSHDSVIVCDAKHKGHVMGSSDKPGEKMMTVYICLYDSAKSQAGMLYDVFPKCYKEDEGKVYPEKGSRQYYCGGDGYWHDFFDDLPLCTIKNYGEVAMSKEYGRVGCTKKGWRNISDLEAKYGVCSTMNHETFAEDGDERFLCYDEDWRWYKDRSTFRVKGKAKEDK